MQTNFFKQEVMLVRQADHNEPQQQGEEKAYDTNKMWADLEHVLGETPRTAAACMNLAKNAELKGFRKRRPRKQKKLKAPRAFRTERRKKLSAKESPLPEQEGDYWEEKGYG